MDGDDKVKRAAVLAAAAAALHVLVLLLPLHFRGPGDFGNAFPPGVGVRLTIGFLIRDFAPVAMVAAGLILLLRGLPSMATGAFVATGIYFVLLGISAPFYALPRLQPLLLMTMRIAVGLLLLLAAWQATRRAPAAEPLPPPP